MAELLITKPAPAFCDGAGSADAAIRRLIERASSLGSQFASEFVDLLLKRAAASHASDVHLVPDRDSLLVQWRLDGVLHELAKAPAEFAPNIIGRLKVLSGLLTYETKLPQEGRIASDSSQVEVRVCTFPSLYGERAVIRILGTGHQSLRTLEQLGLPPNVSDQLQPQLATTTGAILVVGPAGSGKTTTAYASLREIVRVSGGARSIASLEDPIEVAVDGVAQSQVNPAAGFDMATGLRSLLRLDPEVIFIGEMRDRATAEIALQAALTGQLVVTTFHAGNCREALNRLLQMGIPQYAVQNSVRLVVAQRLARRLCKCKRPADPATRAESFGLRVTRCWVASGCADCLGTGYAGRCLVAESLEVNGSYAEAELLRQSPEKSANAGTGRGIWQSAATLVEAGDTSPAEILRILGWASRSPSDRSNSASSCVGTPVLQNSRV